MLLVLLVKWRGLEDMDDDGIDVDGAGEASGNGYGGLGGAFERQSDGGYMVSRWLVLLPCGLPWIW